MKDATEFKQALGEAMTREREIAEKLYVKIGEALEHSALHPEEPSVVVDVIFGALHAYGQEVRMEIAEFIRHGDYNYDADDPAEAIAKAIEELE